jgi:hypothetical protein
MMDHYYRDDTGRLVAGIDYHPHHYDGENYSYEVLSDDHERIQGLIGTVAKQDKKWRATTTSGAVLDGTYRTRNEAAVALLLAAKETGDCMTREQYWAERKLDEQEAWGAYRPYIAEKRAE